nr:hypothetical protein [Tanacetum cinerariifolium]
SSSRLISDQSSNPTSSTNTNPKGRNRKRSKQRIENSNLEEQSHPMVTMTDNRTMAELLRAPIEGYAEAIVVLSILAEQFELKHRAARRWLEKEPLRSITTWEDLDRYKDLLCACPHHGFTELHQLDTFYNALNPVDKDSLNVAAGGNLFERKIAKLTHAVNQQTNAVTTAMTAIHKQFQATHLQLLLKLSRKLMLLAEVLIHITSVLPPVATLSQNSRIISKDTFQQP